MSDHGSNGNGASKFKVWLQIVLGFLSIGTLFCTLMIWISVVTPSTLTREVQAAVNKLEPSVQSNTSKVLTVEKDLQWLKSNFEEMSKTQSCISNAVNDIRSDIRVILSLQDKPLKK